MHKNITHTTQTYWKDGLYGSSGRLDPKSWRWHESPTPPMAERITPIDGLKRLSATTSLQHITVGVIGPRQAKPLQYELAQSVGALIAQTGLTLVCGGKSGVMEAVAKGCAQMGGLSIGLLPGHDWREANPYISIPLATGLSEARNMIIAKSCHALIAIGGSYGTLSEIAYGLHFSKPVIVLDDAHGIEGVVHANSPEHALELVATALLTTPLPVDLS